jgi:hypothetical protein
MNPYALHQYARQLLNDHGWKLGNNDQFFLYSLTQYWHPLSDKQTRWLRSIEDRIVDAGKRATERYERYVREGPIREANPMMFDVEEIRRKLYPVKSRQKASRVRAKRSAGRSVQRSDYWHHLDAHDPNDQLPGTDMTLPPWETQTKASKR